MLYWKGTNFCGNDKIVCFCLEGRCLEFQTLQLAKTTWLHLINCWFKCPYWHCSYIMKALSNQAERFGRFFFGRVETSRNKSVNLLVFFFISQRQRLMTPGRIDIELPTFRDLAAQFAEDRGSRQQGPSKRR